MASADSVKSAGFGALGTLFGFPLPSLDYALNLGITPSLTFIDNSKKDEHKGGDLDRGFNAGIKGPDPLPPSWLDRPSKGDFGKPDMAAYEPPEYIPRKPIQPYIPLNPYSDTNVVPSGSIDVKKTVSPLSGSRAGPVGRPSKYPSRDNSKPLAPPSWHPNYPAAETGFIPIEPFFHNSNKKAGNKKNDTIDEIPGGSSIYYSTTGKPTAFTITQKGTPAPPISPDAAGRPDDISPSVSPSSIVPVDYAEDPNHTHMNVEDNNGNSDEQHSSLDDEFSLSDFWGMFGGGNGRPNKTTDSDFHHEHIDMGHILDTIPLNFSAPIDTLTPHPTVASLPPSPSPLNPSRPSLTSISGASNASPEDIIVHPHPPKFDASTPSSDAQARRPMGKPTITKITMDEVVVAPFPKKPSNDNPHYNHHHHPHNHPPTQMPSPSPEPSENHPPQPLPPAPNEPSQPQQLIPPVIIGKMQQPLDWYYTNYNNQNHGDELERFLERHRMNQMEDVVVNDSSNSAFLLHSPSMSLLLFNTIYFLIIQHL